ncbi:2-C-methyl-D-erythritol 2,4-cyclodiphosphate synthase [Anseongella ginsenosidimutans]|uniref:2-C-methyl-D-erythritol 2,4-cyclodiphosphate synthase n=1 Tax=Anseongella ginsenosidimutans TaxID=496056 RepID=A0A4R3KNK1_9SPHI|nr:2-C-methyl-D-erythritol 2,4-cyclodiphosphate synthase [Anseongella ginsenosidimutans]QEC52067.1 2-C-methyl-D-erythritol 2,4-cyclodiphosphate synthase [Anseongella ginsenosidimutans]TCS85619.1 2-C-methyl-D-erythritol 2,4-cyclodiphosphate synthase [Anseongella ginsenosidimutans]
MNFRIGFGYDVHQLKEGSPLFIGGLQLPAEKGAVGHSDADVLLHAICDALLGAANLRDIGFHFSDTDERWKGISSIILLEKTAGLLKEKGYRTGNIDCTLCLERPKVNPHIPAMQEKIAEALGVSPADISIKATTSEKRGFVGREEGVTAYAVALIFSL